MSALLTAIGDQFGCRSFRRAARPATCGADMDVPESRLKPYPRFVEGDTAARMSCPGAMTSGLSRSPPPARSGPREENEAVNGAGALVTSSALLIVAVAPAVAAYALTAERSVSARCTVGTTCRSALIEFGEVLTRIMPTPPASWTARLLLVRPVTPRSQTTILPATLAGSSTLAPSALE